MTEKIRLGHALACLSLEVQAGQVSNWSELDDAASNYLQGLRECRDKIEEIDRLDLIFGDLPQGSCQTNTPHLRDNDDLFVALFLVCADADHVSNSCGHLYAHLNDCFRCFEEYCQVLRDFYQTNQELSKNLLG